MIPPDKIPPIDPQSESVPTFTAEPSAAPASSVFAPLPLRLYDTVLVLATVAASDLLLYRAPGFTGYAILLLLFLAGLVATRPQPRRTRDEILLPALALILIARNIWQAGFWSVVWPVVLIAALATIQRTSVSHTFEAAIHGVISLAFGFIPFLRHVAHAAFRVRGSIGRRRASGELQIAVVAGALITISVFTAVFMVANPIFARAVNRIFRELGYYFDFLIPSLDRVLLWIATGTIAAGLVSPVLSRFRVQFGEDDTDAAIATDTRAWDPATLHGAPESGAGRGEPFLSQFAGFAANTALGVLLGANAIFLLFNALDGVYLWGNASPPSGITFSHFARSGTGWLTFALALSTFLIGASSSRIAMQSPGAVLLRRLSFAWIVQDIFLAFGVFRRIHLYVGFNGLTPLRIFGVWGTLTVLAGVIVLAEKIRRGRSLVWLLRQFALIFAVGMTIAAAFPDQHVCARFNVSEAMSGNERPLVWMFENDISSEGIMMLTPLLDHPDPVIASGASAFLMDASERLNERSACDWRKSQVSDRFASAALARVGSRLQKDSAARDNFRNRMMVYRNAEEMY